jgi:hypothetical protein
VLVIQLAAIEAVCDWCLASDAITSAVAVVRGPAAARDDLTQLSSIPSASA